MKKILLMFLLLVFTAVPLYADDNAIYPNTDAYIPDTAYDLFVENGINTTEHINFSNVLKSISGYIKESVSIFLPCFYQLIGAIIVTSLFKRIFDNNNILMITKPVTTMSVGAFCIDLIYKLSIKLSASLERSGEILKGWLPSFSAVTLLGGGTSSSAASATSFSAVIGLIEFLLNNALSGLVIICGVLSVFEHSSKLLSTFGIVKHLKKAILTVIAFSTTMLLSALTFQNVLASRADGIALRTVKFASASFIPIIGSAVGEALRTVSGGVSYLKSSLGLSAAVSIFFVFAPGMISIIICKIFLRLIAVFACACGCGSEAKVLDGINDIADIMLSIIICVSILSILLIIIFVFVAFGA